MGEVTGNGTAVTGLGGAAGFGETLLPRGDDVVAKVDVATVFESDFTVGGNHFDANQLYISTDGVVSFGAGFSGVATDPATIPAPFFAIFNADADTRLDGEPPESGGVWLDVDAATDCVTITWDHVGFYRRNASQTDTFQMQIFDRGRGSFDVVYRYQNISWTAGDLQGGWGGVGGSAARIGYRLTASGAVSELAASGDQAAQLGLPQAPGNTGVAGLWVFSFGQPAVIDGTDTADTLAGTGTADTMHGFGGSDVLVGSAGADVMDGGSGRDMVDYSAAPGAVRVDLRAPDLNTGMAAGDSFVAIEAFRGSALADTILGSAAADWFDGGRGSDDLQGRAGNDTLTGLAGADRLTGGAGADRLTGGAADDTLFGSLGNDLMLGGPSNDQLFGGAGYDTLHGGSGRDRLAGGMGNDQIYGGTGTDRMDGGPGRDTLTGGGGADRFVGSGQPGTGMDWITDFSDSAGDSLVFGVAGATRADFRVAITNLAGAGNAAVAEVVVTYLPTGILVWTIVDGASEAAITLHSSMNSFDIL